MSITKVDNRSQEIQRRLDAGEAAQKIAADLGVSVRRVYQVRGEKPREQLAPDKIEAVRSAVAGGLSQREAAAQFGISRKTVAKLIEGAAAAKAATRGRMADADIAHIVSRAKAGRSAGTIAREMQIDASAVRAVLRRRPGSGRPMDGIMEAIAAEMDRRGLTPHSLAKLVGAPPTRETLYEYLRGDSTPTTPVASRILKAMGLKIVPSDH